MKHVIIYTDGSCSGNPGPGGWAAILKYGDHEREITGSCAQTTNNRMELSAALGALRALKTACRVSLYTDSAYLERAFNQGWIRTWQRNGWRTRDKNPVLNRDLWEDILSEAEKHEVQWIKVKGHADDALNNRVDHLAVQAMKAGRTLRQK